MALKATHSGECQLCGRKQKLPGGCLAKHGYTKQWGFFEGTCPGSDCKPYEVSCDQIVARIPVVRESVVTQETPIARLLGAPVNPDKVMVQCYGKTARASQWVETQVSEAKGQYFNPLNDQWERSTNYTSVGHVRYYANKWIAKLQADLANTKQYLAWLEERVAQWTEKPLTPVADEAGATADLFTGQLVQVTLGNGKTFKGRVVRRYKDGRVSVREGNMYYAPTVDRAQVTPVA